MYEKPALAVMRPILNDFRCHHCHASERRVLGSIMVHISVEGPLASMARAWNLNLMVGLLRLGGVAILLVYLVTRRFVAQPIDSKVAMLKDIAQGEGDLTRRRKSESRD